MLSENGSSIFSQNMYDLPNNEPKPLDAAKIDKIVQFGYTRTYVLESMRDMLPNYCTAGYYLLEMDQNYCWEQSIALNYPFQK